MVRVAHVHLSACTGCIISFADSYEKLPEILQAFDLVYSITLADEETRITENEDKICIDRVFPDNVDVALVEGSVCIDNEHAMNLLKDVRKKSKLVVAYGSCAATGGVNRFARGGQNPQPTHSAFLPIGKVVKTDFALPGCPPSVESIIQFVLAALNGDMEYLKPFAVFAENCMDSNGTDLMKYVISQSLCMGCGTCASACQTRAITMQDGKPNVNMELCINCGICAFQCPRISVPSVVFNIE